MKKALIFIGLICGCIFSSCNGELSNLPLEPTDKKTETHPKAKTIENKKSVVFRVKHFYGYKISCKYVGILLENGDMLGLYLSDSSIAQRLFLEKGDTVVYRENKIEYIIWKQD